MKNADGYQGVAMLLVVARAVSWWFLEVYFNFTKSHS